LRPPRVAVADLVLDTAARSVSRAGADVPMTTKEYALLEYLARNVGRVVGRAEIAEHVWEETFDPFSNLIEVYVNRLRRKIDAGRATPLLQTRRGAGYILGDVADSHRDETGKQDVKRNASTKSAAGSGKDHA
jgi:two-component system copper resistance phosphate regulon response regulator CusR